MIDLDSSHIYALSNVEYGMVNTRIPRHIFLEDPLMSTSILILEAKSVLGSVDRYNSLHTNLRQDTDIKVMLVGRKGAPV